MPSPLSGIIRQAWRRRDADEEHEFAWELYRATYLDLAHLTDEVSALAHYRHHGRREGRLGTASAIGARFDALEAEYGGLPDDFLWTDYVASHPDLGHINTSYDAAAHYLRSGREEGRLYRRFDVELYRSLYFAGATLPDDALVEHYKEIGRAAGYVANLRDLAAREGVDQFGWLDKLDVFEFDLLNASWAGPVANKADALRAMVREGFERIAPISFRHAFDPDYYRDANPGLAALRPAELYRQWLFLGMGSSRPGTAADHLSRHGLKLSHYPEGFDWQGYRHRPGVFGDSRWALLDHLVANNEIAARDVPVRAGKAAPFLTALGATIVDRVPARGTDLFEAAARHMSLPAGDHALWGAGLDRQGRLPEALYHYELALGREQADVATMVVAVRVALRLGDHERAIAILKGGRTQANGDVRWRQMLREVIQAAFEDAWTRAVALYKAQERTDADTVMTEIAQSVEAWWTTLDPVGLPLPPDEPRRVVMLANVDLRQCTHYRVEQKQEIFARAGVRLDVYTQAEVEAFITALPGASAALFYRLPALPMNIRAMGAARALGITTYYDIDDLIFDAAHYPEPFETYGAVSKTFYHSLEMGVPLFRAAMAMCDYAIASTSYLAALMEPVVRKGRGFVLPNGIDSRNAPLLDVVVPKVRRDGDVVVFYGSGTKAHNSDFLDLVGGALLSVMERHPRVRLLIAGFLTLDERFTPYRTRIAQVGWTKSVADYWSLLAEADINLAVLAPGATTDGKSEIKWLEAATLGVPSIVSDTHRYAEVLADGVDALIARDPAAWQAALEDLVSHPERRAALVAAAREKARAAYGLDRNAARLRTLLEPAWAAAAARDIPTAPRKKRLLLVNIFFPPQTIGGSTRVTRDNLDSFLASDFAKECDFAVVTTDNDNPVPYQVRVEDYRGVPVFRMSTPIEPNMEWRPFNPALGALFDRILGTWRPDLVHVHSIQRSTASILEACLARAIPYINTIHDAWWVSDYHFLVDTKLRLRAPEEPLPIDPPAPATLGEALERRRRLRPLLDASAEVLCVSDAFTALHHAAGYPKVRSVPNGIPPMGRVRRKPSANGRVRLAQVGSQTVHKGYHLVEAALKRGRFKNLELTVVDHARFGGRVDTDTWGATRVRFVGKTKQEEMHRFYADQDVLLAPSLWPESFGLVAREAMAAGLWVLASDRGSIGEGVTPGVNGWVIDVATLDPLMDTLAAIDAAPARYTVPPPAPTQSPRTADDQARDLVAIYRDVFARPREAPALPYFMTGDFVEEAEPAFTPVMMRKKPARR